MDQMIYRQYTIVAWNIIKYNIFSDGRGPELYGTEPWYYYILNGFLNFNIVFLLATGSAICVVKFLRIKGEVHVYLNIFFVL